MVLDLNLYYREEMGFYWITKLQVPHYFFLFTESICLSSIKYLFISFAHFDYLFLIGFLGVHLLLLLLLLFFFLPFLWPHPWYMEIPRLGVELELQPATYIIAHGNTGSFNPLSEAKGQTWIFKDTGQVHYHWAMMGTPSFTFWYGYKRVRPSGEVATKLSC